MKKKIYLILSLSAALALFDSASGSFSRHLHVCFRKRSHQA